MTYVYILRLSNGDLYKGHTDDLKRRLQEHEKGLNASTKRYLPFKLIGFEVYASKSDAKRREEFLKTTEGTRLLKQQYKDAIKDSNKVSMRLDAVAPSFDRANSHTDLVTISSS